MPIQNKCWVKFDNATCKLQTTFQLSGATVWQWSPQWRSQTTHVGSTWSHWAVTNQHVRARRGAIEPWRACAKGSQRAISNTESLPQADYYSLDVCHSPLSGYLQHGRQQKYLVRFWLTIFSDCNFIIWPRKGKIKFLKVCKILKRTTHFKTDWILCVLNCRGCSHIVKDAVSTCSCC